MRKTFCAAFGSTCVRVHHGDGLIGVRGGSETEEQRSDEEQRSEMGGNVEGKKKKKLYVCVRV